MRRRSLVFNFALVLSALAQLTLVTPKPASADETPQIHILKPKPKDQAAQPRSAPGESKLRFKALGRRTVQLHPKVILVFWGTTWSSTGDPYNAKDYMTKFVRGLGGAGDDWTTIASQYCLLQKPGETCPSSNKDRIKFGPGTLARVISDKSHVPAKPTYSNILREATKIQNALGKNARTAENNDYNYVIATPYGVAHGADYCAWHGVFDASYRKNPKLSNVVFTFMPYIAGDGLCGANFVNPLDDIGEKDSVSIALGHEIVEAATDADTANGWKTNKHSEIADLCDWDFSANGMRNLQLSTGTFAVQGLFSNNSNNGHGACINQAAPFGAPGTPTNLKGTTGDIGQCIVSFNRPTHQGASPIISYVISLHSNSTAIKDQKIKTTRTKIILNNLGTGAYYSMTVRAINNQGASLDSDPASCIAGYPVTTLP